MSPEHEHIGRAAVAAKEAMNEAGHELAGLVLILETADGDLQMAAFPHDDLRRAWSLIEHARAAVEESFAGEAGLN